MTFLRFFSCCPSASDTASSNREPLMTGATEPDHGSINALVTRPVVTSNMESNPNPISVTPPPPVAAASLRTSSGSILIKPSNEINTTPAYAPASPTRSDGTTTPQKNSLSDSPNAYGFSMTPELTSASSSLTSTPDDKMRSGGY